jgi:hypothetical protein
LAASPQPLSRMENSVIGEGLPTISDLDPDFHLDSHMYERSCVVIDDVIDREIIDYHYAQTLLSSYAGRVAYFPFVDVPLGAALDCFRLERPFLLLTILTTSSGEQKAVQDDLEYHLRQELGRRSIVQGEQSLDILQGLLVYLAWYK